MLANQPQLSRLAYAIHQERIAHAMTNRVDDWEQSQTPSSSSRRSPLPVARLLEAVRVIQVVRRPA